MNKSSSVSIGPIAFGAAMRIWMFIQTCYARGELPGNEFHRIIVRSILRSGEQWRALVLIGTARARNILSFDRHRAQIRA